MPSPCSKWLLFQCVDLSHIVLNCEEKKIYIINFQNGPRWYCIIIVYQITFCLSIVLSAVYLCADVNRQQRKIQALSDLLAF